VVHEHDQFDYELGDDPHIKHVPARLDRGKIIAAYSIATLKSGEKSREVMWVDEIEDIRKLSRYPEGGPWAQHYGEMCKKTVAKRHSKVLPMSTDLDDLLRREDEDEPPSGVGPAVQPKRTSMADNLAKLAPLPEAEEMADEIPHDDDGVVIENEAEVTIDGR